MRACARARRGSPFLLLPKPAKHAAAAPTDAAGAAPTDAPRRSRPRRLASIGLQLLGVLLVLWGVGRWQTRRLLSPRTTAPAFSLTALDGTVHTLGEAAGRKVVLYFFAPWCKVCGASSSNDTAQRALRSESELAIYAVGLEWEDAADLSRFARAHELRVPVLRGNAEIERAYRIDTFPTIYVIDEHGAVQDRVIGYTTELGLRLRSW